jgi:hypothetical protein
LDLLGRARSFFKGLGPPPEVKVQYYSVVCPRGHRVRGQRTLGYQALRCPACGEGVFVLPASPLPEPVPPPRPARARSLQEHQPVVEEGPVELKDPAEVTVDIVEPDNPYGDAEIVWEDEEAEPEPLAPPETPRTRPPAGDRVAAASSRARPAQAAPRPRVERAEKQVRNRQEPRRPQVRKAGDEAAEITPEVKPLVRVSRQTSLRVPLAILAGVCLLVLGTIALRSWRARRGELPLVAQLGYDEGIPALKEGRFDRAYQVLSAARDAVDALHDEVDHATEIRHAADEAKIFVNLLSDSLESLLDEAARTTPSAWATRFENVYKGRGVIIDAGITQTPETSKENRYELDYTILSPGEGDPKDRKARIDLTGFEAVTLARPRFGDHVVIGGLLESFQFDPASGGWLIRLESKSGVSIKYQEALQSLGWPSGTSLPEETTTRAEEP